MSKVCVQCALCQQELTDALSDCIHDDRVHLSLVDPLCIPIMVSWHGLPFLSSLLRHLSLHFQFVVFILFLQLVIGPLHEAVCSPLHSKSLTFFCRASCSQYHPAVWMSMPLVCRYLERGDIFSNIDRPVWAVKIVLYLEQSLC